VLAKVKSQTEGVLKTLDNAEVRSRAMGRALKKVEALPDAQVPHLIPMDKDHDTDSNLDLTSEPSSPHTGGSLL
jgi:DNA recombination protein RmuC